MTEHDSGPVYHIFFWQKPLAWGRSVAGSRNRFLVFFFVQVVWFCFVLYGLLRHTRGVGVASVGPALLGCVFLPGCYLYVIYRLIRMLDEKEEKR
jgi:hypothetical protein